MTNRSVNECQEILQRHTFKFTDMIRLSFVPPPQGTVMASIHGARFRLSAQGPHYVKNSFVPFFYARLEPTGSGARIVGSFQMHPFVRIFMVVWFGGLAFGASCFVVAAITGKLEPQVSVLIAVAAPVGMLLFGIGLVRFGKWTARGQVSSMREFIRTELGGQLQDNRNRNQQIHGTADRRQ